MKCSDPDCDEQGCPETSNWNVGVLCHDCYQEVKGKYGGFRPQAIDDFVKVHVLLQYNTQKCVECIRNLSDEMSKAKAMPMADDPRFSEGLGQNYLKLSRALEYYEGYCWFPANRILLTGLLGRVDFYKNLKYGFNKDPGAGVYHGDQSHRVQWHVIMRCMTNDFQTPIYKNAGWNHSPLGLFYKYTQADSKPDNPNSGAWAISMDKVSNAGWGSPDFVARYLKESGPPLIKEAVLRRMEKLLAEDRDREKLIAEELRLKKIEPGSKEAKQLKDLINSDYDFKKVVVSCNYERQQDEHGNNIQMALRGKDAPDRLVEINEALVQQSETEFNTGTYLYDELGAKPCLPCLPRRC